MAWPEPDFVLLSGRRLAIAQHVFGTVGSDRSLSSLPSTSDAECGVEIASEFLTGYEMLVRLTPSRNREQFIDHFRHRPDIFLLAGEPMPSDGLSKVGQRFTT